MAYSEVAKCFEKELSWLLSLSKAEVKVISQELGRVEVWSIVTIGKCGQ